MPTAYGRIARPKKLADFIPRTVGRTGYQGPTIRSGAGIRKPPENMRRAKLPRRGQAGSRRYF